MFVLCCNTKARTTVNWQSVHCVAEGSWPVSLTLKGPLGIKQRELPVIVTASVIARLLPRIFKPWPLYPILFKALCFCGFSAGQGENTLPPGGSKILGSVGLCTPNKCCMHQCACQDFRVCVCVCLECCSATGFCNDSNRQSLGHQERSMSLWAAAHWRAQV